MLLVTIWSFHKGNMFQIKTERQQKTINVERIVTDSVSSSQVCVIQQASYRLHVTSSAFQSHVLLWLLRDRSSRRQVLGRLLGLFWRIFYGFPEQPLGRLSCEHETETWDRINKTTQEITFSPSLYEHLWPKQVPQNLGHMKHGKMLSSWGLTRRNPCSSNCVLVSNSTKTSWISFLRVCLIHSISKDVMWELIRQKYKCLVNLVFLPQQIDKGWQ